MAQKKSRQTFEKLKREQAIREKRVRKQERKAAARLAKTYEGIDGPPGIDGPTEIDGSTEIDGDQLRPRSLPPTPISSVVARSIRPRGGRHHSLRVLGQPFVVVAANLRERGKSPRDPKTRERDDRHRARQLGNARGVAGRHARRLLYERVCRQEVEVATSPGLLVQCIAADRE